VHACFSETFIETCTNLFVPDAGTTTTTAAPAADQQATMTLMSGQVIALPELFKAANSSCCVPRALLGDFTPIVRMDGSKGKYYATADPSCKTAAIESFAYPAMFEAINMCGSCAGGKCPLVDGGRSQHHAWNFPLLRVGPSAWHCQQNSQLVAATSSNN